jgi:hypothetical protein
LLFNEAFQLAERLAQQYPEILYRRER